MNSCADSQDCLPTSICEAPALHASPPIAESARPCRSEQISLEEATSCSRTLIHILYMKNIANRKNICARGRECSFFILRSHHRRAERTHAADPRPHDDFSGTA